MISLIHVNHDEYRKKEKSCPITSIIKQLCGILDNNIDIKIPKSMHLLPLEKYHEINHFALHGVLTYKPKACMHCGIKNTGNQDIIKHDFKTAIIRLPTQLLILFYLNYISNALIVNTLHKLLLLKHH